MATSVTSVTRRGWLQALLVVIGAIKLPALARPRPVLVETAWRPRVVRRWTPAGGAVQIEWPEIRPGDIISFDDDSERTYEVAKLHAPRDQACPDGSPNYGVSLKTVTILRKVADVPA